MIAPEFSLKVGNLFDGYDRKGQRIFLGEYAVNGGNTIASMECALAESVIFIRGLKKSRYCTSYGICTIISKCKLYSVET